MDSGRPYLRGPLGTPPAPPPPTVWGGTGGPSGSRHPGGVGESRNPCVSVHGREPFPGSRTSTRWDQVPCSPVPFSLSPPRTPPSPVNVSPKGICLTLSPAGTRYRRFDSLEPVQCGGETRTNKQVISSRSARSLQTTFQLDFAPSFTLRRVGLSK